jgi:hypothetical protein
VANSWRGVRSRILTPNVSATRLDVRGFHVKDPDAKGLLETIGRAFLTGYAYAAEAKTADEARVRLDEIPTRFRGFAYEGAAMGFAVLDALPGGGSRRLTDFVAGAGADHIYMVYVGMGWAMARVPRLRWTKISTPDPLLRWLVLDGYGFHQAYFHTRSYVEQQYQAPSFPWPRSGSGPYVPRVIDQGIGRALWFVAGTDTELVASAVEKFAEHRRADLYSGVGLAATYAGGATEKELRGLWQRAGDYRPQLALGCAFAAEARLRADLLVPHVELACQVFCDMPAAKAAYVCAEKLPAEPILPDDGALAIPSYEVWRQGIADEFLSLGRC